MTRIQKTKMTRSGTENGMTKPIRLQPATIAKLQKLLAAVNKKDFGKRVRPDAVIDLALSFVGASEIERLQQSSMSNADRFEAAYLSYAAKDKAITKDAFMGMLLAGMVNAAQGASGADRDLVGARADAAS